MDSKSIYGTRRRGYGRDASAGTSKTPELCWTSTFKASSRPNKFIDSSGPFLVLSEDAKACDYFGLLFPESLMNLIVTETNRYASQKNQHETTDVLIDRKSRLFRSGNCNRHSQTTSSSRLLGQTLGFTCATICPGIQ